MATRFESSNQITERVSRKKKPSCAQKIESRHIGVDASQRTGGPMPLEASFSRGSPNAYTFRGSAVPAASQGYGETTIFGIQAFQKEPHRNYPRAARP